jgi:hypothetical protein
MQTQEIATSEAIQAPTEQPAVRPKLVALPSGSSAEFFTREQLTIIYRCSHGELGRMLSRKLAPLPIRVDGVILWFVDEVVNMQAQVMRTLERWRQ